MYYLAQMVMNKYQNYRTTPINIIKISNLKQIRNKYIKIKMIIKNLLNDIYIYILL